MSVKSDHRSLWTRLTSLGRHGGQAVVMKVYIVVESHGNKSTIKGAFNSSEKARAQVKRIIYEALRHAPEAEVEDLPNGKRVHSRGFSVVYEEWILA